MASTLGGLPLLLISLALLCLPPLLSLRVCLARTHYLRHQARPRGWFVLGVALSGAALVFNAATVVLPLVFARPVPPAMGTPQIAAALIAWVAFGLWVFMKIAFRHPRRPG